MLAVSSIEKLQFSGLPRVGAVIDSLLNNVGVQHAVDGYWARTNRQQEQAAQQHGIIDACFMRHRPKAGRFINASPKTEDCCEHGDDQRDSRQTGEKTYDQQGSADYFNQSCEWSEQPGGGNTKFGEKAWTHLHGKEKFLDAFKKKDAANREPDQQDRRRRSAAHHCDAAGRGLPPGRDLSSWPQTPTDCKSN